jgi:hypothetical protein
MSRRPLFESRTCSRCGGTGRYAGFGACFLCGGAGYKLTPRGRAAQRYLDALRRIPAEQFVPGMLILAEGFTAGSMTVPSKWHTVERVEFVKGRECGYSGETADRDCVRIVAGEYTAGGFVGETTYRRGFSNVEKNAQREQALAYQATLTQRGTPARKAKAVTP